MKLFVLAQRFLCLMAILGVILGPVSISMAESAMAAVGASGPIEVMPMSEGMEHRAGFEKEQFQMVGDAQIASVLDMPCCPKAKPVVPDCQKNCPLALICSSLVLVHPYQVPAERTAILWTVAFALPHDQDRASAQIDPPARPPRA